MTTEPCPHDNQVTEGGSHYCKNCFKEIAMDFVPEVYQVEQINEQKQEDQEAEQGAIELQRLLENNNFPKTNEDNENKDKAEADSDISSPASTYEEYREYEDVQSSENKEDEDLIKDN